MNQAAKTSDFEKAIKLRNYIFNLNKKLENLK